MEVVIYDAELVTILSTVNMMEDKPTSRDNTYC